MSETRDQAIGRQVLMGTLSNYLGKVFTLSVWFVLTPFVLGHLGATLYGIWVLIGSVAAYGSLLDLGIGGAVIKYVAEHRSRGELDRAQATVATVLRLYVALGTAAVLIGFVVAPLFPSLFTVPDHLRATTQWTVFLSFVSVGIAIPTGTPNAVLRGLNRFDVANALSIMGTIASSVSIVLVLSLHGGIIALVVTGIAITLAMFPINIWAVKRVAPDFAFGWRGGSSALVRPVFTFSTSVFVVQLAGRIQMKTDEIVIGAVLPVSAITPYALARRLSDTPQILTDQFMKVLLPIASELSSHSDRVRLQALYLTGTRLALAICTAISVALIVLGGPLLSLWIGESYRQYGYLVVILVVATLIDTSQWPAGSVLQGMARHQPLAIMAIASALANLGLSVVLAHRIGLVGVALGTLIPTSVESLGFVMPYTMNVLHIGPRTMIARVLAPALVPAIPSATVMVLAGRALDLTSFVALVAVALAGLLTFLVVYLLVGASAFERQAYRGLVTQGLQLGLWRH